MSMTTFFVRSPAAFNASAEVSILDCKKDDVSLTDSIPHAAPFDLRADFLSQGYGLFRIFVADGNVNPLRSEKTSEA